MFAQKSLVQKNEYDHQQLDCNMNAGVLRGSKHLNCSSAILSYCSLIIGRARALGVWSSSHLLKHIFILTYNQIKAFISDL